jgi:multisubunit Na+/H+ antiporter MnhG subunit
MRDALVWILVMGSAGLTFMSALGAAIMRDPYQRLHFLAPIATVAGVALVAAFWLGEANKQAGAKVTLSVLLLLATNAVVTHATASAMRSRGLVPGCEDHTTADEDRT